jgi:hypothetical protein
MHTGFAALLVLCGSAPELHTDVEDASDPVVDISWEAPPEC